MSTTQPAEAPGQTRSARKRAVILDAARQVFFANGYVGTSMDEIAAVASVSKQTVYKHFADKETLFHELITSTVLVTAQAVTGDTILPGIESLEDELRAFARHLVHGVMQPEVLQLRRLVIGEATRFPTLGRAFYDLGARRTIGALSAALSRLADAGHLAIDDPELAAEHLNWLVLSIPLNRAMLLGNEWSIPPEDLDRYADAGVATFLSAYRNR
jgi:TetR/AcrR family transcriptional repressor of mexJK operon